MFILVPLFYVFIVSAGLYLLFRKSKPVAIVASDSYVQNLDLSECGRSIRLKELNKKTYKPFTLNWLIEYLRGERTAFNAWFAWFFVGGLVIKITKWFMNLYVSVNHANIESSVILSFNIFQMIYLIFASTILWKCSVNSSKLNKYLLRLFIIVCLFLNAYLFLTTPYK